MVTVDYLMKLEPKNSKYEIYNYSFNMYLLNFINSNTTCTETQF